MSVRVNCVTDVEEKNLTKVVTVSETEFVAAPWYKWWRADLVDEYTTRYITTYGFVWYRFPSMKRVASVEIEAELQEALKQYELQTLFAVDEDGFEHEDEDDDDYYGE